MIEDEVEVFLNGISCKRYKLSVVDRPLVASPKRQVKQFEVLGAYGSIYERYGYQDISYSVTFNYLEGVESESFKRKYREIRSWIYHSHTMQFSDEPEVSYQIKDVEIQDAANDIEEYGQFNVKFILAPFGKLAEKMPITFTKSEYKLESQFTNQSIYQSLPVIHIYGNGDCSLFINDDEPIIFNGITNDIIVDSEKKLTYRKDGKLIVNESSKQSSNNYPSLESGVNKIILNGKDIDKIEIWRNMLV